MIAGVDRNLEIQDLKARAAALEVRLRGLSQRIDEIRPGTSSDLRASVDPDRCVSCGICAQVCPAGAVTVSDTAQVDVFRCMGCGRCAAHCPRGAIRLRPSASFNQAKAVLNRLN